MSDFLKEDEAIASFLSELDKAGSEDDRTEPGQDAGSELEDNVEVELDYKSDTTVDDTDADPDFYPSDHEQNPVLGLGLSLDSESDHESTDLLNEKTSLFKGVQENRGIVLDLPSTSKDNVHSIVVPKNQTNPIQNIPSVSTEITDNSSLQNQTILTLDFENLENDDPVYVPDEVSSSSDDNMDMEIDPEEVTDTIRLSSHTQTQNSSGIIVNLPTHAHHRNIVIPKKRILRGKNKYVWSSSKPKRRLSRTPRRNIIHYRQQPINDAKNVETALDSFNLYISPSIVNQIVVHTNVEISHKGVNYSAASATIRPTDSIEIKALIGLLIMSAAMKDNHLTSLELFDSSYSGTRYISVMSRERFDFLLNCLRFDDKISRPARRLTDRLAPIRAIWEEFIEACRKNYSPGSYVTIDEQLLAFRGRCPFRMYIPSKPNKYGIKIIMLCDVKTKYLIDGMPYLGKQTNTSGLPLGTYYATTLTKTIHGTYRNVTMDNWFTSVPLANEMIHKHKLTIVGTLRSDKKEIPKEMKEIKSRKLNSSMFCYNNDTILVSYKAKPNKMVYLISTTHEEGNIAVESGKPEIVEFYNSTKGAVDAFDEMSGNMSCSRKTQRWPLCFFYGILNSAIVNSYVIYVHTMIRQQKKPLSRRQFAKDLSSELMKPWLRSRLRVPTLQRHLKTKIEEILGETATVDEDVPQGTPGRKICSFCPSKKRRMSRNRCCKCQRFMCGDHHAKVCVNCC